MGPGRGVALRGLVCLLALASRPFAFFDVVAPLSQRSVTIKNVKKNGAAPGAYGGRARAAGERGADAGTRAVCATLAHGSQKKNLGLPDGPDLPAIDLLHRRYLYRPRADPRSRGFTNLASKDRTLGDERIGIGPVLHRGRERPAHGRAAPTSKTDARGGFRCSTAAGGHPATPAATLWR